MRFIRGDSLREAIDRFHADETLKKEPSRRSLELRKLLRRFTDVCNAIGYAHSRGVLHRDIKPGNIIVGKHGETLVVDWGLAKVKGWTDAVEPSDERPLVPSSASGSAETLPGSALGTPAYMSPEQARGDLEHLGPPSDVYSLGATLHCLLTGKPPVEGDDVGAVLRIVQQGAFPPPRQLDPTIDRALEAICLEAMALKPDDRYPSPRALAEDVERWMADEPVSAYREPLAIRLGRWGRRHKPHVVGAAALLIAATIGLTVGTILLGQANRRTQLQRQLAEANFRKARQAVDEHFTKVSESKLLNVPGLQPLRKDLLESARAYYEEFLRDHGDDRSVRAEAAEAWYRVGFVTMQVGRTTDALDAFRKAVMMYEALSRGYPDEARYSYKLARSLNDLAHQQGELGRRDEWVRAHEQATEIFESVARRHPDVAEYQKELAISCQRLSRCRFREGRDAEALRLCERSRDLLETLVRRWPDVVDYHTRLATSYEMLGTIQSLELRQEDEALRSYALALENQEAVVRLEPDVPDHQVGLARGYGTQAALQHKIGRVTEALASHRRTREIAARVVEQNPAVAGYRNLLATSEMLVGSCLMSTGRVAEAIRSYRASLETFDGLLREDRQVVRYSGGKLNCLGSLASAQHRVLGQLPEALATLREALELAEEEVREHPGEAMLESGIAHFCNELGQVLSDLGRADEALQVLGRAAPINEKITRQYPSNLALRLRGAYIHNRIGQLHRAAGRDVEATRSFEQALSLLEAAMEDRWTTLYQQACTQSLWCQLISLVRSELSDEERARRDRYADRAIAALRSLIDGGFRSAELIASDPDFEFVRSREDFQLLLMDLAFPAEPFARGG
jgi:serine/threonine-protein kinase